MTANLRGHSSSIVSNRPCEILCEQRQYFRSKVSGGGYELGDISKDFSGAIKMDRGPRKRAI